MPAALSIARTLRIGLMAPGLALAACDSWLTKPSLYNTVTVVAARRNGEPIPGVDLLLYTGPRPMGYGTTDSTGRFVFTRVPEGQYGVVADVPSGYTVLESVIAAPESRVRDNLIVAQDTLSPVRFTFLKQGPGTIVVRVRGVDGTPIQGARVEAYDPNRVNARTTTDAAGVAVFPALPFGVHGILVERPTLFRDFVTPGDSAFSIRQDLIVEDGSRDSLTVVITKCSGTLSARVQDETGAPVPRANVVFYSATEQFGVRPTGTSGVVQQTDVPCAIQLGITLSVPPGYSIVPGRNSSFFDGITLVNGETREATFRLRRVP